MGSKLAVFILLTVLLGGCLARDCITNSPCSCTYDDGSGDVDITSLAGPTGQPRLKDVWDAVQQYQYSYNPCRSFNEGTCNNVAVCETTISGGSRFTISGGYQDTALYSEVAGQLQVEYKTRQGEFQYTTTVTLSCDDTLTGEPQFEVIGAQTFNTIKLGMTHACLCPGKCNEEGLKGSGISVGSVLCIIFFVSLVVYFGAGTLFLFFVKKQTWSQAVPQGSFWVSLPGYIKDGGQFLYQKVTTKTSSGEYESLK